EGEGAERATRALRLFAFDRHGRRKKRTHGRELRTPRRGGWSERGPGDARRLDSRPLQVGPHRGSERRRTLAHASLSVWLLDECARAARTFLCCLRTRRMARPQ